MDTAKLPITVLIQTKNEEKGIRSCIEGVDAFEEVIVVDSNSKDRTVQISESLGATVVNFTWNGLYPKKKQWQLDEVMTKHEWVLFLDADETPSRELIHELRGFVRSADDNGFVAADIRLDYVFSGRTLRHGHTVVKRALVRRGLVGFPVVDDLNAPGMGELEGHYQPVARGKVGKIKGRIHHNDKDPVRTWFDRHNRYSDWEAHLRYRPNLRSETAKRRSLQGRIFDKVPFKPMAFFVYSYGLRRGFLDGRAGLDYSLALSMYYWQISLKVRELRLSSETKTNRD